MFYNFLFYVKNFDLKQQFKEIEDKKG